MLMKLVEAVDFCCAHIEKTGTGDAPEKAAKHRVELAEFKNWMKRGKLQEQDAPDPTNVAAPKLQEQQDAPEPTNMAAAETNADPPAGKPITATPTTDVEHVTVVKTGSAPAADPNQKAPAPPAPRPPVVPLK